MEFKPDSLKILISFTLAVVIFAVLQFAFIFCFLTYPRTCHAQLPVYANIIWGFVLGAITYIIYSLFQREKQ